MEKKYIVRLSDQERTALEEVVKRLAGSSQKVKRANILLMADANGPAWTDKQIPDAYRCRTKTVENVRQRLVERGFEETLEGRKPEKAPREKALRGNINKSKVQKESYTTDALYAWTLVHCPVNNNFLCCARLSAC